MQEQARENNLNFKVVKINDYKKNLETEKEKTLFRNSSKKDNEMKNIRKRKDGRWEGKKTINGKRISVYAKTQKECYQKWKELKTLPKTKNTETTNKKYYLSNYAIYWVDNFKKHEVIKKSYNQYKNTIKNYLNINKSIKNLTLQDLQNIINPLPKTRTKEFVVLTIKQIFNKAEEENIIKLNYSKFLNKGKIEHKKITWFSLKDQEKILKNLNNLQNLDAIRILIYLLTGCRPNEIKLIKEENIKENFLKIDGTKTINAVRWVKISNRLFEIIKKFNYKEIFIFNYKKFRIRFKDFLKAINVETKDIYSLRHTFATNLYYLGVPDKERQTFLGHHSSALTNDIYTDYDPTIKKEDIINLYKDLYPEF